MNNTEENNNEQNLKQNERRANLAFCEAKTDRAKELLTDITMFTTGCLVFTNPEESKEWFNAYFLELLAIGEAVEDKGMMIGDFFDELRNCLFNLSFDYMDKKDDWVNRELLSINSEFATAPESKAEQPQTTMPQIFGDIVNQPPSISDIPHFKPPTAPNATEHYLQVLADKLAHLLRSDDFASENFVSPNVLVAIEEILIQAANESGFSICRPDIIRSVFPDIIRELPDDYGRGVVHSLSAILDTLPTETRDELQKYERRIADAPDEREAFAARFADLLNSPLMPEHLRNIIGDEINIIAEDNPSDDADIFTPESIGFNLGILRTGATAADIPHSKGRTKPPTVKRKPVRSGKPKGKERRK